MVFFFQRGASLMESVICVALMGLMTTLAAPSFFHWKKQTEFVGAIQHSHLFIQHARSYALSHRRKVYLSFDPSQSGCIGLSTQGACDCHASDACQLDNQTYQLSLSQLSATLTLNSEKATTISFDGIHGLGFSLALTLFVSNSSHKGKIVLSNFGRARFCADSNELTHRGVPQC